MKTKPFDLIVIGGGSAGVRAARTAASLGARTALVERNRLGGTCVNVGCVPKKLFVYASELRDSLATARSFGWAVESSFDWPTLLRNKDTEISRLNGIYASLLEKAGVEIVTGEGRLDANKSVCVGDETLSAENILIATGGHAMVADFPGAELAVTSDDMFSLQQLPGSAAIVGGGYIACEFASILQGMGVQTTLLYRDDLILSGFDEEARRFTSAQMQARGIEVRTNVQVAGLASEKGRITIEGAADVVAELVLIATGRAANTSSLGLAELGVETSEDGAIGVDDSFSTNVPGIYACGDVIDRQQLTPVALAEGMCVAHNLFGNGRAMNYENIPTTVFSIPNFASVGLGEEVARERFSDIDVYTSDFKPMKHSLEGSWQRAFMKLVVDSKTQRVLGAQMVGDEAGEIIQGLAIAVQMGATKADFDQTIGIHPTAAEEFVTMRQKTR